MRRLSLILFALLCLPAGAASAAPCTTATVDCTEWVTLEGGPSQSLVYRTFPLEKKNQSITRALIFVHGALRNADGYYRSALAAGFLAGALDDTIVIAPRIASNDGATCGDVLAPNEVNWTCIGQDRWTNGGPAVTHAALTSFDLADEILRKLARKDLFPNLKAIVVAGHSAGGHFVARYHMANQLDEKLGVSVTYVVANPNAYMYLDGMRPAAGAAPEPAAQFQPFADARNCTAYNQWPYGLHGRTGYSARLSDKQLRMQMAIRPVSYLLGERDLLPDGMDLSCPAMAQGPTRLARGVAFHKYVNHTLATQYEMRVIPACGHSERCMFTSELALPLIFPKQEEHER